MKNNIGKLFMLSFIALLLCNCEDDTLFLENVDFNDGEYALYLRHKTFGEFMVLDEDAIRASKDELKINFSLGNFLPGEGDRNYGLILFKNNEVVKRKIGGLFSTFEIGGLKNHATPVVKKSFSGIKEQLTTKLDSLHQNKNTFISRKPKFNENGYEFSFRVFFPTVAVPVKRTTDSLGRETHTIINDFDEDLMADNIKQGIFSLAKPTSGFETTITSGTLSNSYLVGVNETIRTEDRKPIYLDDFIYYQFEAYIRADKSVAEKLMVLDYSSCLTEEQRLRSTVLKKMNEKSELSTIPNLSVENENLWLFSYHDNTATSKLYEQEYSVAWLEIVE